MYDAIDKLNIKILYLLLKQMSYFQTYLKIMKTNLFKYNLTIHVNNKKNYKNVCNKYLMIF